MNFNRFWDAPDHLILAVLIAIALVAMAIESFTLRKSYDFREAFTNLAMYAGFFLIDMVWIPVVYQILVFVHDHSIFKIGESWYYVGSSGWTWVALFVLDDFCYYWFHRVSHKVRFFWASHSTHHSSNYFNLSVGFRQTWFPFYAFIFWLPLAWIGFDPLMILTMQMVSLALQGILHTEVVRSFGKLDAILNSPSHHRVHHGTQKKYVDRNFAGVLIVWDRLFRTFQKEEYRPTYGIGEETSYNPIRVGFGPFLYLLKKEE